MTAAETAAWCALLRQPVLSWRLGRSGWIGWGLLGGAVLALAAFGIALSDWRAGMMSAGVFLTAFIVACWLEFLGSAIRQNQPALACLVPRQHGRIVRAVAAGWALAGLSIAVSLGLPFGHFGYVLLAAATALLYLAALQQWPALLLVPLGVMILDRFVPLVPGTGLRAVFAMLGEPGLTLAGLALLLAPAVLVLRLLLPRGGDRHLAWQRRYDERAQAMKEALALPGQEYAAAWRPSSWLQQPYLVSLRRLSERLGLARAPRNRAQALLFALRSAAHPGAMLGALAASVAFVLAAGSRLGQSLDRDGLAGLACVILLVTPLVTHVHAVLTALQRYRTEQALLRLTPLAPTMPASIASWAARCCPASPCCGWPAWRVRRSAPPCWRRALRGRAPSASVPR
ncbi:hypothetical protein [Pseudoduganella armeniaca]|uniref:Uncharacterized protein n=1 Tax=Pseudoduganella armeniaca TaxID=2072590 RepID=A0A2R4CCP7_9BURK|nr:hypothetical protein [Pseudoduganella armeniaca]AVR97260.1 hypothetical protein C9I28_17640 [Pseudoduganella armeniaca]